MTDSDLELVFAYHERTKHFPGRFARSLGYLDWDNQPDPFRRYLGAPPIELDEIEPGDEPGFDRVLAADPIPRAVLDRRFVSQLFYDSLALSAFKEQGRARWSLRVNPSSGNLHPTEGYLICAPIPGLSDGGGIFHYAPFVHALEERVALDADLWRALTHGLPDCAVLVGLSSITWREAWKYGERAFRYCHHDVGHAIAAISIAAAALGWQARLIESIVDPDLAKLLGIDRQTGIEAEHPDCLILLAPAIGDSPIEWKPPAAVLERLAAREWQGTPAALSRDHQVWPIIEQVEQATEKRAPAEFEAWARARHPAGFEPRAISLRQIVRTRRSAVDFDGETTISRAAFYRMLASTLPSAGRVPFAGLPWSPRVHLLLFVHRVDDLEPGLYFLSRDPGMRPIAQAAFRKEALWEPAPDLPEGVVLDLLIPTDVRNAAELASCRQAIAADGAFAVAMIARFGSSLLEEGSFMYERLHWEAGAIGQVLYLEAEAAGVRATGIGCFFDDVTHELCGIQDRELQTIYHFTVGGPVEDPRLRTLPGYAHRNAELAALVNAQKKTR